MKIFLCILMISLATMQDLVVATRGLRFDSNKCCNVEKSQQNRTVKSAMKKVFRECKHELGYDTEEGKKQPGKVLCIMECFNKKNNIIDASGNINEAEFNNAVKSLASGDHQTAVAEDVAKKCIEDAKAAPSKANDKCSSISLDLGTCVNKEFFKSCPADKQGTSEKCVKMRERINGGDSKSDESEKNE